MEIWLYLHIAFLEMKISYVRNWTLSINNHSLIATAEKIKNRSYWHQGRKNDLLVKGWKCHVAAMILHQTVNGLAFSLLLMFDVWPILQGKILTGDGDHPGRCLRKKNPRYGRVCSRVLENVRACSRMFKQQSWVQFSKKDNIFVSSNYSCQYLEK